MEGIQQNIITAVKAFFAEPTNPALVWVSAQSSFGYRKGGGGERQGMVHQIVGFSSPNNPIMEMTPTTH